MLFSWAERPPSPPRMQDFSPLNGQEHHRSSRWESQKWSRSVGVTRTPAQPSHTPLPKAQPEKPGVICDVRACARGCWGHAVRKRRPDTQSKARLLWQWGRGVGERLPLNPDARYRERAIGRGGPQSSGRTRGQGWGHPWTGRKAGDRSWERTQARRHKPWSLTCPGSKVDLLM